ncbi:MAG: DUF1801 domain-containing protein [Chloroflexi bacterium]|nr:DUF1801 domain-containing protein [Chloroflexota bacterium]MBA3740206.1 DUF1801 domain-containing protein [Chloroflexota bacterium]
MTAEVDAYLAKLPENARATLEILRKTIRAVAPDATETISYGVPGFKLKRPLVSYGAARNHCALYVMSPAVMEALADELRGYDTSKGTVRFPIDQPLPAELVKKLVQRRIAETEAAT